METTFAPAVSAGWAALLAETNALHLFQHWLDEAPLDGPVPMTLATVRPDGHPTARVVYLHGVPTDKTGFRFFTSLTSPKAQELEANPHAALTFYWSGLDRQVRVEGVVHPLPPDDATLAFSKRPRANQLGVWASPQSQVLSGPEELAERLHEATERFASQKAVPRPPQWGGYAVHPTMIEFWAGNPGDLPSRLRFERAPMGWQQVCLAP
ncbi:pyridoxamine 5'-phosphate oxidase [Hymenobacter oligotrophus]|uniref:Pyridoxamine 5'-phosphate oxidase n=1 Tax=Hymenobacter oligotrophus TaxID=2319843 RepID=A0A3B7R224_9BACT|nr:pyridoxamine 5'-phosphate oxidase [Hymenobacter oligotrophus]AYA37822.1 pyridoxamine 5'-phosphate oxidase [Hymenobacter oligotrophus]